MADILPGILAIGFAALLAVDALLFLLAWAYSRLLFNGHLKRYHRDTWEQMVHGEAYQGVNLLSFDKTGQLFEFRYRSREELGDPALGRIRRTSIRLFRAAIALWLTLVAALIAAGAVIVIVRR